MRARRLIFLAVSCCFTAIPAFSQGHAAAVHPVMILPFVALLLAIAIVPFISKQWWGKNYPFVAVGLGAISVAYYLFVLRNPVRLLYTGMEYISFIALIGSLFVVAGGMHIRLRGRSTPLSNVALLGIGAVISNIVGTTGASMILIRPYLRVNRYRIRPFHVVFFIFVVSNMGGALTPIGDPPLFLGYLKGVPFFWVAEALWYKWALAMVLVLGAFYAIDVRSVARLPRTIREEAKMEGEEGSVEGLHNIVFLVIILIAVFITDPPFVREVLMVLAAAGSYFLTKRDIHERNDFNFHPIKEVAFLFLGIFATMVPALDWLELNAASIGIQTAGQFYWACGSLSSVLDNAPTYLNFLSASFGLLLNPDIVTQVQQLVGAHGADLAALSGAHAAEVRNTYETLLKYHYDMVASGSVPWDEIATAYMIGNHALYLQAISISAVFFGSMTYIGNGPNFMVKSIAEQAGVKTPSFFGYVVRYSAPVLIPVFLIIWFLFMRGQ